ncbi:hypothetical protein IVB36_01460 [Bradyrhizobium sp. 35]|uniref:hypothetical protein n=1 Tax=Bradyrhizobium sp. 35 TaxID=2782670 RepID=UPI001FFABBB0|nr:hypothetical protein [Bradyrhizobium sp. 35]MCK1449614.1 hypothetical protein [Bradyrhizobium sp. 35]
MSRKVSAGRFQKDAKSAPSNFWAHVKRGLKENPIGSPPAPPRSVAVMLVVLALVWWCSDHSQKADVSTPSSAVPRASIGPYPDPEGEGDLLCQRFAKTQMNFPASADFDWGIQVAESGDGRTWIAKKFTAKNAFGVPQRFKVECWFDATSMKDARVVEIID